MKRAAALQGSDNPEVVRIDLANRKVHVFKDSKAATLSDSLEALGSGVAETVYTQDDTEHRVSQWSSSLTDSAGAATAAKPAMSVAALIGLIENYLLADPTATGNTVYVDQITGKVTLIADGSKPSEPSPADAIFDQSVSSTPGTIRNAFE